MSIFSKVKSAAKKYVSNVVGGAKIVGSALSKAGGSLASIGSGALTRSVAKNQSQIAATTAAFNNQIAASQSAKNAPISSQSRSILGGAISAQQSGGGGSSLSSRGASPIYSAPVTLRGGSKPSAPSSLMASFSGDSNFFGSSINSGSMASSPSISLPSAPSYSNPGQINNGGLISTLAESFDYNPESNSFLPVVQEEGAVDEDGGQKQRLQLREMLNKMIPQKESVMDDPAIRKQQREIQKRKEEVANYTAQLNNVVAQQNADLLRLRGIGSQEGVTETVYGGQAATINREAAIKALPIQASLSAAQGNLELAQDYLTQLTTWKQEQINNDYDYKKQLYASISDFVTGEEKILLDRKNKESDREYQEATKNIEAQDEWAKYLAQNGQYSLINRVANLNPASPTFRQELYNITSRITPRIVGGGVGSGPGSAGGGTLEEQLADLKLSTGQKGDVVDIQTLSSQISQLENFAADGVLEGIGGLGIGGAKQALYTAFGKGSQEGADVRILIGNIKGQIAKLRGGTSFTENEEKLLNSYVPGINESTASVLSKIKNLKTFLKDKQEAIIRSAGGTVQQANNDPLGIR